MPPAKEDFMRPRSLLAMGTLVVVLAATSCENSPSAPFTESMTSPVEMAAEGSFAVLFNERFSGEPFEIYLCGETHTYLAAWDQLKIKEVQTPSGNYTYQVQFWSPGGATVTSESGDVYRANPFRAKDVYFVPNGDISFPPSGDDEYKVMANATAVFNGVDTTKRIRLKWRETLWILADGTVKRDFFVFEEKCFD
jgi:hypothetical protein